MPRILLIIVISLICLGSLVGCKKSSGGGTTAEENLSIGIDPDPGISVVTSLAATYDFKVLIKSKMPSGGVKIDVACTKDADNSIVFSQSLNSSITPINTSVNNLQSGVVCTVRVTVTSLSKSSNTASLSFKVARK